MNPSGRRRFVARVTVVHALTYLVVGMIAAAVIDYSTLFESPIVRDYMRPFGSVSAFVGPAVQLVRGLVIALVLIPLRPMIGARHGWLRLWALIVVIGVVSTSAAAPSSIEGIVYTQLPIWYHAIGLPEMLLQTLVFSAIVAWNERHPLGLRATLPSLADRIIRAVVAACLAFAGYAVASVGFAIAAGAPIRADQSLTLRVQGVFILPLVVNAAIVFLGSAVTAGRRRMIAAGVISYVVGAAAIVSYHAVVMGAANLVYAVLAPVLPAVIVAWGLRSPSKATHPDSPADRQTARSSHLR